MSQLVCAMVGSLGFWQVMTVGVWSAALSNILTCLHEVAFDGFQYLQVVVSKPHCFDRVASSNI